MAEQVRAIEPYNSIPIVAQEFRVRHKADFKYEREQTPCFNYRPSLSIR
jgi:hypothetical protein